MNNSPTNDNSISDPLIINKIEKNETENSEETLSAYLHLRQNIIHSLIYNFCTSISKKEIDEKINPTLNGEKDKNEIIENQKMNSLIASCKNLMRFPKLSVYGKNFNENNYSNNNNNEIDNKNHDSGVTSDSYLLSTTRYIQEMIKTFQNIAHVQSTFETLKKYLTSTQTTPSQVDNQNPQTAPVETIDLNESEKIATNARENCIKLINQEHDYFHTTFYPNVRNTLLLDDYIMNMQNIGKKPFKSRPPLMLHEPKFLNQTENLSKSTDNNHHKYQKTINFTAKEFSFGESNKHTSELSEKELLESSSGKNLPKRACKRKYNKQKISNELSNTLIVPCSPCVPTHIEHIKYTEISTPSWRIFQSQMDQDPASIENITECITDEAYITRHEPLENDEHQKYIVALQLGRRSRKKYSKNKEKYNSREPEKSIAFIPTIDFDLDGFDLDPSNLESRPIF